MVHLGMRGKEQTRPYGAGDAHAPVWPRVSCEPPIRHPARPKFKHRNRGEFDAELAARWGFDLANSGDHAPREILAPEKSGTHRGYVWLACGLGIAVIIAGYSAYEPRSQLPVTISANTVLAADVQAFAPAPPFSVSTALVGTRPMRQRPANSNVTVKSTPALQDTPTFEPLLLNPIRPSVQERPQELVRPSAPLAVVTTITARQDAPTIRQPAQPISAPVVDSFVCADCVSPMPRLSGITLSLFTFDTDVTADKDWFAAAGASDVRTAVAQIAPRTNQVRFYRPDDAAAAQALAQRYNASLVDLTWFAPADQNAKIDILLAEAPSGTAIEN